MRYHYWTAETSPWAFYLYSYRFPPLALCLLSLSLSITYLFCINDTLYLLIHNSPFISLFYIYFPWHNVFTVPNFLFFSNLFYQLQYCQLYFSDTSFQHHSHHQISCHQCPKNLCHPIPFLFYFFGHIQSSSVLLLTLQSGIMPGGAWGAKWNVGHWTWLTACMLGI